MYICSMNSSSQLKTFAKKRTANFREDETRLLISLWGSPSIQNKLNLTHRKAPVMRLLAANMQQRGFYRSPDEIKTRIRNLKCLYHRIKRTITSGSGIGTVDPDWPHFKAMDAILGKSAHGTLQKEAPVNTHHEKNQQELEAGDGQKFEIKQEIDVDFNDDLESWNGNESIGSEYDEDLSRVSMPEPAITITTAPTPQPNQRSSTDSPKQVQRAILPQQNPQNTMRTVQNSSGLSVNGLAPSIPLPFLILNSLKPGVPQQNITNKDGPPPNKKIRENIYEEPGLTNILSQLLNVQKQHLDVEKERLELEKQRLEFDRVVGSQLMTLVPMMGSLVQRLVFHQNQVDINKSMGYNPNIDNEQDNSQPEIINHETENDRLNNDEDELEKNRNILRNLLNEGLKARLNEQKLQKQHETVDLESEDVQLNKNDEEIIQVTPTIEINDQEQDQENDNESCVLLINENSEGSEN